MSVFEEEKGHVVEFRFYLDEKDSVGTRKAAMFA